MKILFLHHYAGSLRHGMSYRVYYLAREWVKAGHDVHIHAAAFSHIRTIQPKLSGNTLTETIDEIKYTWYKTPTYSNNSIKRVINIFSFSWKLCINAKKISIECNPDVIIAASTHPLDIFAAQMIKKQTNAKLIFEVRDLWPLTLIELGNIPKWHPFIMLMQQAERYAYRKADSVVTVLPKADSYMIYRGMHPSKFHYIPNGIEPSEWVKDVILPDDFLNHLKIVKKSGKPIVGYAGAHGLANALDTLIDAAKLCRHDFEVVLVGNGPERDKLITRVQQEKISNVTFLPAIAKVYIPAFLKEIDIAYIGWIRNPLYRFGISPNKLMDYMMAGKPIIHAVEAGNDPVAEAKCGLTITPGDANMLKKALMTLINAPHEERDAMGKRGKAFILEKQTYPVLARQFIDVMVS